MNEKLYNKCKSKGLKFTHVAEVGVYLPETSNILNFIRDGIKSTLVEADPEYVTKIKEYFDAYTNIILYPFAVWDKNGFINLNKANSSSFVDELESSPAIIKDKFISNDNNKISVEARLLIKLMTGQLISYL
ncbi:MAG: hypothetical protein IPL53_25440 [Ignavibacteria bacterium]|nr:hypothetical protein [Ignavibacteria bacterium]